MGILKLSVMSAQNVPFETSNVRIDVDEQSRTTQNEEGTFPKFGEQFEFHEVGMDQKVEVVLCNLAGNEFLSADFDLNQLKDQKVHDVWVKLKNSNTYSLTDVRVRIVARYIYKQSLICEEAISGWKVHLKELK